MDESIIRGLIIGVMFTLIGLAATGIWKLMRSPSEGARRVRWVLAGVGALLLITLFLSGSTADKGFLAAVTGVIVAAVWIYRGFKKPLT